MKKPLLFVLAILCIATSHAIEKIVIANNGSGWSNENNWLPLGVPENGDLVIVPAGKKITIKGNIYNPPASLFIHIFGTVDFEPSGKLDLTYTSTIQIFAGGKIESNGTNSEQIKIGGILKYSGQNDGTVEGPSFASIGSPASIPSSPGGGFETGVLPVQLVSFTYTIEENKIVLKWTASNNLNNNQYILERKNADEWKAIATFFETDNPTRHFSFTDKDATTGINNYRVKIVHANGGSSYSKILLVQCNRPTSLKAFPNPSSVQTRISWNKQIQADEIVIYNSGGAIIIKEKILQDAGYFDLNVYYIKPGIYTIGLMKANNLIEQTRLIKQ